MKLFTNLRSRSHILHTSFFCWGARLHSCPLWELLLERERMQIVDRAKQLVKYELEYIMNISMKVRYLSNSDMGCSHLIERGHQRIKQWLWWWGSTWLTDTATKTYSVGKWDKREWNLLICKLSTSILSNLQFKPAEVWKSLRV